MNGINQTKILVRYNGKYLLLKKVKDIHPEHVGCWEVPGGKIKDNEDPIKASLREIKEETGLSCKIIAELKFLKLEKNGIRTNTHVYLAEPNSNRVIISNEHSDYRWISYNQIDNIGEVIYRDILKQYILDANKIKGILNNFRD